MTPEQWMELIKVASATVTPIVLGWLALLTARTNKSQVVAAEKVEEVRTVLETTTTNTDTKLDEIKVKVNGAMSAQMKIGAVALRRLANLSGHADDIKAASLAEEALAAHEKVVAAT